MQSHTYRFTTGQLLRAVGVPLTGLLVIAVVLHAAEWLGVFVTNRPADDPDQTLLVTKIELSSSHTPAAIVFVGDSSCATGVEAPELGRLLPRQPRVLNLALIIGMGLPIYGEILSDFLTNNPSQVRLVVLLVTPQLLSNESLSEPLQTLWRQIRSGASSSNSTLPGWRKALALPIVKEGLLRRISRYPFRGKGAEFYGFSTDLRRYLLQHQGTMVDPGIFTPPRHPTRTLPVLAPALEAQSREFRNRVPADVKLAIGLTPIPESYATPDYQRTRNDLLEQWNAWIKADYVMTNLPAALPDGLFATMTHLSAKGQDRFTKQLARALVEAGAE